MKLNYRPRGVCSSEIEVELEDGKISAVTVFGGCSGNAQGLSRLLVGMDAEEAIGRLEGVKCGFKSTSCPDQIAKALRECLKSDEKSLT